MGRVHVVELRLELKSQLDLLLVVLSVLSIILFQLEAHLLLIHHFSLQLLAHLLLGVQVLFEHLLVVGLFLRLFLVVAVQLLQLGLVLLRDLTDQHSVISAAAVLEQDCKNLPDIGDHRVFLLSVLQAGLNEFIEANRVHEETPVDPVNVIGGDACIGQDQTVDSVPRNRVLMFRL